MVFPNAGYLPDCGGTECGVSECGEIDCGVPENGVPECGGTECGGLNAMCGVTECGETDCDGNRTRCASAGGHHGGKHDEERSGALPGEEGGVTKPARRGPALADAPGDTRAAVVLTPAYPSPHCVRTVVFTMNWDSFEYNIIQHGW